MTSSASANSASYSQATKVVATAVATAVTNVGCLALLRKSRCWIGGGAESHPSMYLPCRFKNGGSAATEAQSLATAVGKAVATAYANTSTTTTVQGERANGHINVLEG